MSEWTWESCLLHTINREDIYRRCETRLYLCTFLLQTRPTRIHQCLGTLPRILATPCLNCVFVESKRFREQKSRFSPAAEGSIQPTRKWMFRWCWIDFYIFLKNDIEIYLLFMYVFVFLKLFSRIVTDWKLSKILWTWNVKFRACPNYYEFETIRPYIR